MPTIISSPLDIDLSRHPIMFGIQAGSAWISGSAGVQGVVSLTIPVGSFPVPVGSSFTVTWNGGQQSVTFVAAAAPVPDDGFSFNDGATLSYAGFLLSLVLTVEGNYEMIENFSVVTIAGGFQLTSIVATDVQISTDIPGATASVVVAGSAANPPANYKIRVDVEARRPTGSFERVGQVILPASAVLPWLADVRIDEILDGAMEQMDPPLTMGFANPYDCGHRHYRIKFAEQYGKPVLVRRVNTSTELQVIKGGVPGEMWPWYAQMMATSGVLNGANQFMTLRPKEKVTTKDSLEWLCWYAYEATGNYSWEVKMFFDGGSNSSVVLTPFAMTQGRVYNLPCGYAQLGLSGFLPVGLNCVAWKVRLTGEGVLSPWYMFYVATACPERPRHLVFYNSIGGYDTVVLLEDTTVGVKTERDMSERITLNQVYWHGENFVGRKRLAQLYKVGTGWVSKAYAEYLADMFRSRWVWELQDTGYAATKRPRVRPVVIVSDSVELVEDGNGGLNKVTFQYQYSDTDEQ